MNKEMQIELAKIWLSVAKKNDLKKGTKAYSNAEFYYWMGVLNYSAKLEEELPAFMQICLMSGRSVSEELLKSELQTKI